MEELSDPIQPGQTKKKFEEQISKSSDPEVEKEVEGAMSKLNCELNQPCDINIDAIPVEMLELIFQALDTSTKLRCRLVCRKWNEIMKKLPGSENLLIVDEQLDKDYINDCRWFETNRVFYSSVNCIRLSQLNFEKAEPSNSPFLSNLKRLRVDGVESLEDASKLIAFINRLVQLEELEIFDLKLNEMRNEMAAIDLPNLKALSITRGTSYGSFKLNAPQLRKFRGRSSRLVSHPNQLTELWLDDNFGSIKEFPNVEVLKIREGLVDRNVLAVLPKLKELWNRCYVISGYSCDYEKEKERILEILEEKRKLGRTDLKIVFFSIHLENASQLDGFEFDTEKDYSNIIQLQMKNYDKLVGDLSYLTELDYGDLLDYTNGQIPADFHQKYTHVDAVHLNQPLGSTAGGQTGKGAENAMKLIKFYWQCRKLERVFFENSFVVPEFLDVLAQLFPSIEVLSITEEQKFSNFDFILKFKNLKCLAIFCQKIPIAIIQKAFEQFNEFNLLDATERLTLNLDKKWSRKKNAYKFSLSDHEEIDMKFDSLEAMIEMVKELKEKENKKICKIM